MSMKRAGAINANNNIEYFAPQLGPIVFHETREKFGNLLERKYGLLGQIIRATDIDYPLPRRPMPPNNMDETQRIIFQEELKCWVKRINDQENKHEMIFAEIWEQMSNESRSRVQAISPIAGDQFNLMEWDDILTRRDPLALWKRMIRTHQVNQQGSNALTKIKSREDYECAKMTNDQTVVQWKNNFDELQRMLVASGNDPKSDEDQAADFIAKLSSKLDPFKNSLRLWAQQGIQQYPNQLADAFTKAVRWEQDPINHISSAKVLTNQTSSHSHINNEKQYHGHSNPISSFQKQSSSADIPKSEKVILLSVM